MLKLLVVIFGVAMSSAVVAAPQSIALNVATMVCGPDPHNIKQALQAVPGVIAVTISLDTKTAMVSFDNEKSSVDALLKAVASVGYAALAQQPTP
jgi:periplasmic mercuric ion binding protein